MKPIPIEPSLRLLIDCCRCRFGALAPEALASALRQADGERLAQLARRHGLETQVWSSLREAGVVLPGTAALGHEARRLALAAGDAVRECSRLTQALAQSSLPHLFLGGPALAALAWGDPSAGGSRIRLLVAPGAIAKAAALLGRLGFVQEEPDPSVDTADWHRRAWRSRWRSDDGVLLDLQTRLAEQRALPAGITGETPPLLVAIGQGVALPTLPARLQLAWLSVLGCSDAWHRLRWAAELAAIVHNLPAGTIGQAAEQGARLGVERPLAAGLVLANRLFGTPLPAEMWFDEGAARLVKIGLAQLTQESLPRDRRLGMVPIILSRALLRPGSRYFLGEGLRQTGAALMR